MKTPAEIAARRARFMRARVIALGLLLLGAAGAVVHRAFTIQVEHAPMLREMAEDQYFRDIHLAPKRGSIYDRGGAELAVSVDVDSVYANPRLLRASGQSAGAVAAQLAQLLGVDAATLGKRLIGDKHFAWLKRRVSPKEAKAIQLLGIPGIELTREPRRFYPNRELAAHVLGFANIDGEGIEGVEKMLDDRLKGAAERVPALRDRRGVVVFSEQLVDDRASRGDDVTLTLDKAIQHVTERELELGVRTFEAHAGSVIVLDPRNGEILAMANFPTFNPNSPASVGSSHWRNRSITDRFEPGSTIKPLTVGGALAAGTLGPHTRIFCEQGSLEVAEYTIHDTHKWDDLSAAEIIAYSSNIGTAKIGMGLGRSRLYRTLRDFGLGSPTGIGLPGEIGGHLRHYKRWYEMDAATIAFGQGMSVTTLQLTNSLAAIANQGRLMRPTVVRRIEDAGGDSELGTPRLVRQVVSAPIARALTEMMIGVTTEGGTGTEAAVPGFLVAGKTGTAQKADYVHGGYAEGKWVSSFVGFVPARKPRLVIAVVIDEPMIAHHGGTVAAPIFRRIAQASLRHLGVVGLPVVSDQPAQAKARSGVSSAPPVVVASVPPLLPAVLAPDQRAVPDLLGKTARQALLAARAQDLELAIAGTGLVRTQQPTAGEVVPVNAVVRALLEPPTIEVVPPPTDESASAAPELTGGKGASAVGGGALRPVGWQANEAREAGRDG